MTPPRKPTTSATDLVSAIRVAVAAEAVILRNEGGLAGPSRPTGGAGR